MKIYPCILLNKQFGEKKGFMWNLHTKKKNLKEKNQKGFKKNIRNINKVLQKNRHIKKPKMQLSLNFCNQPLYLLGATLKAPSKLGRS